MKKVTAVFAAALIVMSGFIGRTAAQVIRTKTVTNAQGEFVETPYLSRSEFMNAHLGGPHGTVSLDQIMTVTSIEEATRLLGEPDSTDITHYPDEARYDRLIVIFYKGIKIEYVDNIKKIQVDRIEIDGGGYHLTIGDEKIRPGMPSAQLSSAIRRSSVGKQGSSTRSHIVKISDPAKPGQLTEHEALNIKTDLKTGKVTQIRYSMVV